MDLNLLVSLDALLAEGNVTRAAARVGLSQPAMSNALGRLRKLLDDPLLVRTPRGMVPTPRAQGLAVPLRTALSQIQTAFEDSPEFIPATSAQTFTLATTDYAAMVLVPRLLQRLSAHAPWVNVELRALGEELPQRDLESGRCDLAIGFFPEPPPGLYRQPLFRERLMCVVREGHPLVKKELGLREFVMLPHVLVSPDGPQRGIVDEMLAKRGVKRRILLSLPHFLVAPVVIAQSDAVATMAERVARTFSAMLPLRIFEPPIDVPGFSVLQVWHERTHHDVANQWLRRELLEVAATV